MTTQLKTKQPKELYVLFFTEMWERFNYYGMRALLVLYMIYELFINKSNFGDTQAYAIYAAYGSLVYATPYIGGIIADRFLGYRKSIIFGGILMAAGEFMMMIPSQGVFYFALAFIIVGNGFFKPNISSIVGRLYDEDDPRRDGGFTIFYMGINIGAAIAPIITALVMDIFGYSYAFGLAGVGMIFGLITFIRGQKLLGDKGNPPDTEALKQKHFGLTTETLIYIGSIIVVPIFMLLMFYYEVMEYLFPAFGIFVLGTLIYNAFKGTKVERERMFVVIVLIMFSVMFWAFFEQAGSSLTLFTELNVNRWIGDWHVPTPLFQSVNAFFIIILGPVFATMWMKLNKIGKEPSTPLKFVFGLLFIGLGFGSLVWGANFAENGLVPIIFIILIYLLNTIGELSLSPVGLSMVTKLSPKRMVGMVMGAWMLAVAFAQFFGGMIAKYTSTDEYMEKVVRYEPKLGVTGTDKISVKIIDPSGEDTGNIEISLEMVSDPKAVLSNTKPDAFYVYRSIKPNETLDFDMRVSHLDPNGDKTKIDLIRDGENGNTVIEKDDLSYTPTGNFTGSDTIIYNVTEIENNSVDLVKLIITIDNEENHAPVIRENQIARKVWEKPWYAKSSVEINVLDYVYDLDGDVLSIEIVEKPDFNQGTASVNNGLNSYVGPNKTIHIYSSVFKVIFITAISTALFLLLLVPLLRKWMHGVH